MCDDMKYPEEKQCDYTETDNDVKQVRRQCLADSVICRDYRWLSESCRCCDIICDATLTPGSFQTTVRSPDSKILSKIIDEFMLWFATHTEMESEMKALRRELEGTRTALRLQTTRCRQLVAAFTTRLQEKDAEIRASRQLRDQQLSRLLRALLALEARLRREQKQIRAQLAHRDLIIQQQQVEISRLQEKHQSKLTTSHIAATPSELIVVNHTCSSGHKRNPLGSPTKCQSNGCETVVNSSHLQSHRHKEAALRVLELVDTPIPLLNGETAAIVDAVTTEPDDGGSLGYIEDVMTPPPDVVASYNEMNRECLELANMAASLKGKEEEERQYQDNPVLECVNLILLRDEEDFQDEQRRLESAKNEERGHYDSLDSSPHSLGSSKDEPIAWYNTKEKCPPKKMKEREVKMGQRLSIFDTSDGPVSLPTISSTCKSNVSLNRSSSSDGSTFRVRGLTPPALPPKPKGLSKLPASLRNKESQESLSTEKDSGTDDHELTPEKSRRKKIGERPDTLPRPHNVSKTFLYGSQQVNALTLPEKPLEDGSNALRRNFEEFNLDDCEIEGLGEDVDERPEGDGAEARNGHSPPTEAKNDEIIPSYDNFLEATGMSNKSILTPSRMLSNHRSVLKPKDVKHRSRVKAERCLSSVGNGPTVKYWTEPFL